MPLLHSTPDPSVEVQLHDTACGAACIVMLVADRGIVLDQRPIADRILPSAQLPEALRRFGGLQADEFVRLLAKATRRKWKGGNLEIAPDEVEDATRGISTGGSWAALIGPRKKGHWVVVDRVDAQDMIHLRDPSGHRRSLWLRNFCKIWAPGYIEVLEVP